MGGDIYEHIDAILESVQDDIEDPVLKLKLRTVRQLCKIVKKHYVAGPHTIDEVDINEEMIESLRELGYFE